MEPVLIPIPLGRQGWAQRPANGPPVQRCDLIRGNQATGAESMKDMGRVMKQAMAAVDGRADGEVVSGLVRSSLQG